MAGRLWRIEVGRRAALLASCRIWAGYAEQVSPRSPRLSPKPDIGNHHLGARLCAFVCGRSMFDSNSRLGASHPTCSQAFFEHMSFLQFHCIAFPRYIPSTGSWLLCQEETISWQCLSTALPTPRSGTAVHVQLIGSRQGSPFL